MTSARAGAPVRREGLVVACRRRRFAVRLDDGETIDCVLKGRATALACGDRVTVARVAGGGAIEAVAERRSLVYRSDAFREKLVAANVTLVCGVVAAGIAVDLELVHRWTVAAEAEGCAFVLAANKADLADFPALLVRLEPFARLGYPVVELAAKRDATPLLPWLAGAHTVLIGQSGMGKSTILNALAPDAGAKTAEVSTALATGRHTTSHSTLHALPAARGDGWIVDSPGMKAFGLAHVAPDELPRAFVELRPFLGRCRFRDCRHEREPGCAVREAVDAGLVAPHRLALLHELVAASTAVRAPGRPRSA
ncbi:MAG TPA: ribosome small subunit-dependent GTPase A [Casimicrobiaceae bacterium]|nr:ribosome small subunit-dependent GTPase A [Casimicrobiaceae bacterium]